MSVLQIADFNSGEVFEIKEINSRTIGALKKVLSQHVRNSVRENDWRVLKGDPKVADYIEDYLNRIFSKDENEVERFVGINFKPLKEICEDWNTIEPLHICQGLSANILNTRYAINEGDKDWLEELQLQRREFYEKAWNFYGLNVTNLNFYLWGEYHHNITDYRFL